MRKTLAILGLAACSGCASMPLTYKIQNWRRETKVDLAAAPVKVSKTLAGGLFEGWVDDASSGPPSLQDQRDHDIESGIAPAN